MNRTRRQRQALSDRPPEPSAEGEESAAEEAPIEGRVPIRFEMDRALLAWFIKAGPGYQSRMNAVLNTYAKARGFGKRRRKKKESA